MTEQLRWGVIGSGRIASAFVADLHRTGVGRAVAVGSRSQASADRFAAEHGVERAHGSYEALVADGDVQAVYVATPHPMHHDNALLALGAGRAVLVEKAFTMDADEARRVVKVARMSGLFLMEAMWTRFLPHIAEIRKLLAAGTLGPIVTVTADHGQWFAPDPASRLFAPELGGGALLDLGVYPVSFASMVLGPPDRIESMIQPAFTGVDAQTSILLGHAGGAQALLSCTSAARTPTRATVIGTDGRLEIDGPFYRPTGFTLVPRTGDAVRYDPPWTGHGLWYEAAEVARCLRDGLTESPLMPLDETVSVMATMDAVRSART